MASVTIATPQPGPTLADVLSVLDNVKRHCATIRSELDEMERLRAERIAEQERAIAAQFLTIEILYKCEEVV